MQFPVVISSLFAATEDYQRLLLTFVATCAGDKGRSLLILMGIPDAEICTLYNDNPRNEAIAIYCGLLKYKDVGGTWGELIEAMREAGIGLEYREALLGELRKLHVMVNGKPIIFMSLVL